MIDKKIAINTFYLFLRMVLVMGVTLFTSRIILKELGVIDYGIYNVVAGLVTMVSFLNTALANGYQRYFNISLGKHNTEELQRCFSVSLVIQLAVVLISIIICESIGLWFLNHKMMIPIDRIYAANWIYQTSVFIFSLALLRVPFHAIIIAYEKMDIFAYLSVIEVLLQLGVVFSLSFIQRDRLISYGNLMAVLSLGIFISYVYLGRRVDTNLKLILVRNSATIKGMLSFSGWNIFGSLAHIMRTNGLNVLLNMFFSPVINAANGFASQISNAVTSLSQNVLVASRPQVMKNYAQNKYEKMMDITYTMSRYVFYFLWVLSLPIILNIKYIYSLWLGNETPPYTEMFTVLVLINNLLDACSSSLAAIIHATGNMKRFQILVSVTIMSVIPLSFFFLKNGYPPQTVFYINICITVLGQIVRIVLIKSAVPFFSIRQFVQQVVQRCIRLSIISILIVYPISIYLSSINSLLTLCTCIITTFALIFIIGLDTNERKVIVKYIKQYIK